MGRHAEVVVTAEQAVALERMVRTGTAREVLRARALLLTRDGWTQERIGAALGVTTRAVAKWRRAFRDGEVAGLIERKPPGASPERGRQALAIAQEALATRSGDVWTAVRLAALCAERGVAITAGHLCLLLKRAGLRFRRPRHTLKGRQDAAEVD